MGNDDRGDARERFLLGEYWNDIVAGGDAVAPEELDPSLAETVRWLHAGDPPATLDAGFDTGLAGFDTGLKERLMSGTATFPANPNGIIDRVTATDGWTERTQPQPTRRPIRGPRALWHVAEAAVLVLALGGLAVALGGSRLERWTGSGTNHVSIPAPLVTPAAPPGFSSEMLFSVMFPDEAIPQDGFFWVDLVASTWPPGAQETAEPRPDQNGPVALYVMEGTLTNRIDGPRRVVRADGSVEEPAPGVEVVLEPGDLSLQFDHGSGSLLRNSGSTPVRFVVVGIIEALDPSRFSMEGGAHGNWTSMNPPQEALQEGSVIAAVRRVTAEPGTTLTTPDEPASTTLLVESGRLTWQVVDTDASATPRPSLTYGPGRWVIPGRVAPDRTLVMSNAGDEPLVYLEFTVAPADTATTGA